MGGSGSLGAAAGAIEIGRAPGVVTISLRVPVAKLKEKGLWNLVQDQYHLFDL